MSSTPYLSLILPAYNERARICRTVREVQTYLEQRGYGYEVLVAADGNDGTREAVAEVAATDRRLQVLGSPERGGKGRGIRRHGSVGRWRKDQVFPPLEFDCGVEMTVHSSRLTGASKAAMIV